MLSVLFPSGTWVPFNPTKPMQTKIRVTMESDKNKSTLTNLAPKGKKTIQYCHILMTLKMTYIFSSPLPLTDVICSIHLRPSNEFWYSPGGHSFKTGPVVFTKGNYQLITLIQK